MTAADFQLLFLCIPGNGDHFHPITQRFRNIIERIGRGDEQHPGQVEWQIQIMVHKRGVLFRVQHFQHGRRQVAGDRMRPHLIDFIDHEHRVAGPDPLKRLNDLARHGPYIGTAMSPDLGLITHAADRHPDEFATDCPTDRMAQRGLAGAGWPHEAQDRTGHVASEFCYRHIFNNPFLGLFKSVVILIQYRPDRPDIHLALRGHVPGDIQNLTNIVVGHLIFLGNRGQHTQPVQLRFHCFAHIAFQTGLFHTGFQYFDLRFLSIPLAQV